MSGWPAVRSLCQCEILLITPHFQWGGACNDSVLAGVQNVICLGYPWVYSPKYIRGHGYLKG